MEHIDCQQCAFTVNQPNTDASDQEVAGATEEELLRQRRNALLRVMGGSWLRLA